jgi:hypothetical protein
VTISGNSLIPIARSGLMGNAAGVQRRFDVDMIDACPPNGGHQRIANFQAADRRDIGAFLRELPPMRNRRPRQPNSAAASARGE